ncbi:MAG: hypothetical protein R8J94_13495 [Acidimicrobiia bacterium]|nr:hypothetical protein [Acidimicrobiia bacterium]
MVLQHEKRPTVHSADLDRPVVAEESVAHITATDLDRLGDAEKSVDGLAEWLLGLFVAISVVVLNAEPFVLFVDVADHLLVTHLRLELDPLITVHAIDLAAWLDESRDCTTHLLDLDGFAGCRSSCHTFSIGRSSPILKDDRLTFGYATSP